jgi:putative monooxygenase
MSDMKEPAGAVMRPSEITPAERGGGARTIHGVEHELGPHDTTWIPADVPHRFRNASETEPMRIFWTYASVDATRTLIATGETRPVSAEHAKGGAQ